MHADTSQSPHHHVLPPRSGPKVAALRGRRGVAGRARAGLMRWFTNGGLTGLPRDSSFIVQHSSFILFSGRRWSGMRDELRAARLMGVSLAAARKDQRPPQAAAGLGGGRRRSRGGGVRHIPVRPVALSGERPEPENVGAPRSRFSGFAPARPDDPARAGGGGAISLILTDNFAQPGTAKLVVASKVVP